MQDAHYPAPRALAVDVDGTLLKDDHTISPLVKQYVRKLQDNGYPVTLVSARPPKSVLKIAQELQLVGPMVALNGAIVLDDKKEILYRDSINKHAGTTILSYLANQSITCSLYAGLHWYVQQRDSYIEIESQIVDLEPTLIDRLDCLRTRIDKILLMGNLSQQITRFIASQQKTINAVSSKQDYLEVTSNTVSKAKGLAFVSQYHQLTVKDYLAIGDNENDIPMLLACGIGVAVDNATDKLKQIAHSVVASNERDGVAECIAKFF